MRRGRPRSQNGASPRKQRRISPLKGAVTFALATLVSEDPCLNLTEAGKLLGVSRERIRQISNREGLVMRKGLRPMPRDPCEICGLPVGRVGNKRHMVCSWIDLDCPVCGKPFKRRLSELAAATPERGYRSAFARCSRHCRKGPTAAPCSGCGKMLELDVGRSYRIRKGHGVYCSACRATRPRLTHCKRGHPFDEKNTIVYRSRRRCRACGNQRQRERYRARVQA